MKTEVSNKNELKFINFINFIKLITNSKEKNIQAKGKSFQLSTPWSQVREIREYGISITETKQNRKQNKQSQIK